MRRATLLYPRHRAAYIKLYSNIRIRYLKVVLHLPYANGIESAEEYIYSSAKNYAGEKGLVNVETINRAWKTVR